MSPMFWQFFCTPQKHGQHTDIILPPKNLRKNPENSMAVFCTWQVLEKVNISLLEANHSQFSYLKRIAYNHLCSSPIEIFHFIETKSFPQNNSNKEKMKLTVHRQHFSIVTIKIIWSSRIETLLWIDTRGKGRWLSMGGICKQDR